MPGLRDDSLNQRPGSAFSLFRYFVFNATSAENPVSQRYVVGKGIRNLTALLERSAYSEATWSQTFVRHFCENISFNALSQERSTRSSCSLALKPARASSLWLAKGFSIQLHCTSGMGKYSRRWVLKPCRCSLISLMTAMGSCIYSFVRKSDRFSNES